jgi:hypothetical protein
MDRPVRDTTVGQLILKTADLELRLFRLRNAVARAVWQLEQLTGPEVEAIEAQLRREIERSTNGRA